MGKPLNFLYVTAVPIKRNSALSNRNRRRTDALYRRGPTLLADFQRADTFCALLLSGSFCLLCQPMPETAMSDALYPRGRHDRTPQG
jgi:hypothetical protein